MKKDDKASVSLKKILLLSIIVIFSIGIVAFAANSGINAITIENKDGEKLSVITTKTKVSEILEENHIIVLPEQHVYPELEQEITKSNTIIISNEKIIEKQIAQVENVVGIEEVLEDYSQIVERIVVLQEEIPFETITKDISNGASDTTSRIITQGVNGIKEVTYKIQYKNDIEIERTEISYIIIQEPINQVVQLQVQAVSRYGERMATSNPALSAETTLAKKVSGITPVVKTMNASAYCACYACCGKTTGTTASGAKASNWYTIAAGMGYPIGTVMYIPYFSDKPNGGWFVVQDRGGAISNNKIDVFMSSHSQAISFGRRNIECYIYY